MVIAQLHLLVNSAKSVLVMHHQTDEQPSRSEKWLKFSDNVEYAWQLVKNASGRRAAEVFMETTDWAQSLETNWACNFSQKSHSRGTKVHRMGKIGPTEPRGVEGMYQNSRCATREKTWVQMTLYFLKDRKLRNAGGPKLLGLYARDAQVKPYFVQQNLGEMITAEHKVFLIETCESGNNHRYAIVVQNLAA